MKAIKIAFGITLLVSAAIPVIIAITSAIGSPETHGTAKEAVAAPPTLPASERPSSPLADLFTPKASDPADSTEKLGGIIISTSQPEAMKEAAKQNKIKIDRIIRVSKDESFIVLDDTSVSDPRVKALKERVPGSKIAKNHTYKATYTFTDQDANYGDQWNLPKISAPSAWDTSTGSSDVTVAVLDSGVLSSQTVNGATYTQPDFPDSKMWRNSSEMGTTSSEGAAPNCTSRSLSLDKSCNSLDDDNNGKIDDWRGWDFMGGFSGSGAQCPNHDASLADDDYIAEDNDPQPYSCDSPFDPSAFNKTQYDGTCTFGVSACYIGHGTMVGSTAAAASNNGLLISGVDHQAKVMDLRVLDGYGYTTTDRVAAAVTYAIDKGTDVINLSLAVSDCGGPYTDPVLENAMAEAKAAGIIIVAASGNGGDANVCYPASSDNAIAVGASNSSDQRASFSSYGSTLDVAAPGEGIPVANAPSERLDTTYYKFANGTSLATPHVAGLASLVKAVAPGSSWSQVYEFLTQGADKVPGMNGQQRTDTYGYGRINAARTLQHAVNSQYAWNVESNHIYSDTARLSRFTNTVTIPPSGSAYARIVSRNSGTLPWDNSFMRIGTTQPRDRTSQFANGDWLTTARPTAVAEEAVSPNNTGTFDFTLTAPPATGRYNECFNGVAESRRWLPGSDLCYQINVVEPAAPALGNKTDLAANAVLYPGEYLLSADSQSTFILQRDGNVVLYQNFKAVWNSRTHGKAVSKLVMQSDGNLVLYDKNSKPLWHTETYGNSNSTLKLQTDGNLAIYSPANALLWSTDTIHVPDLLGYVNPTASRSIILPGQQLETANRQYRLVFQRDGNVVLYSKDAGALWSSKTNGRPATLLAMQGDGNFVLYDQNNKPIWHTSTGGNGNAFIVAQTDGNLVIYSSQNKALWQTKTYR